MLPFFTYSCKIINFQSISKKSQHFHIEHTARLHKYTTINSVNKENPHICTINIMYYILTYRCISLLENVTLLGKWMVSIKTINDPLKKKKDSYWTTGKGFQGIPKWLRTQTLDLNCLSLNPSTANSRWVTFSKSLNFSMLQFPHLSN